MTRKKLTHEAWHDDRGLSHRSVRINARLSLFLSVRTDQRRNDEFKVSLDGVGGCARLTLTGREMKRIGQLLIDAQRRQGQRDLQKLLAGDPLWDVKS